jgi:hypothetical protein
MAQNVCIAVSPSNQLYIAYCDDGISLKVVVRKYEGGNWEYVGTAGFSAGEAEETSLAFNPVTGQPFVAFSDIADSSKATVMRFDGTDWINVGQEGFTKSWALGTSLALSQEGIPYLAFSDNSNLEKETVMKFDATPLGITDHMNQHISVFPNPTSGIITLSKINGGFNANALEIFDSYGKKVLETQLFNDNITLNVMNYPSGIYVVKLKMNDTICFTKFCKQ